MSSRYWSIHEKVGIWYSLSHKMGSGFCHVENVYRRSTVSLIKNCCATCAWRALTVTRTWPRHSPRGTQSVGGGRARFWQGCSRVFKRLVLTCSNRAVTAFHKLFLHFFINMVFPLVLASMWITDNKTSATCPFHTSLPEDALRKDKSTLWSFNKHSCASSLQINQTYKKAF